MTKSTRQNVLGVNITVLKLHGAVETITEWINSRLPNYICVTPAHGVMDCYNDPDLLAIFNSSGMTTPDGMAIVWLLKLYGHRDVGRVYGPDLMLAACKAGERKGWRHYLYGGEVGVAEDLANVLRANYPEIVIAGTYSPPFRELTSDEKQDVVSIIGAAAPDIVWVGISTPKQERWMAEFIQLLDVPVIVGVGAAFDFISGRKPQAPFWVQRSGLEWLFRLINEPGRLWRRYVQYPKFIVLALGQRLGWLKF